MVPNSPGFSCQHRDGGNVLDVGPLDTLVGLVVNSSHGLWRSGRYPIVVNSHTSPRWRQSREPPSSRIPTLCLVKPVAAWADFLRHTWDFPIGGPPASAWAVSVSLTGTRLGDQASTQRFSNPFGPSKPLLFLTQFTGCVRSVPGARVRSSGRSHVEFVRRGTWLEGRRTARRARTSDSLIS